jgi:hypothetical protein
MVTAADEDPTAADTTWDATGDVALHTSRDASGDHVGLAMSPWLAVARGVTAVPLGWETTRRPCASIMARRPGSTGNAAAELSAGRVVDTVVVAPGRVVVDADGRVVAPVPRVVVVDVVGPLPVVVVPARVVVDARAAGGLRS